MTAFLLPLHIQTIVDALSPDIRTRVLSLAEKGKVNSCAIWLLLAKRQQQFTTRGLLPNYDAVEVARELVRGYCEPIRRVDHMSLDALSKRHSHLSTRIWLLQKRTNLSTEDAETLALFKQESQAIYREIMHRTFESGSM